MEEGTWEKVQILRRGMAPLLGRTRGEGVGRHRKLLVPQCAHVPTGLQKVEHSWCSPCPPPPPPPPPPPRPPPHQASLALGSHSLAFPGLGLSAHRKPFTGPLRTRPLQPQEAAHQPAPDQASLLMESHSLAHPRLGIPSAAPP